MTARQIITARLGRDLGPLAIELNWRSKHG
jgi:hypothetical protein